MGGMQCYFMFKMAGRSWRGLGRGWVGQAEVEWGRQRLSGATRGWGREGNGEFCRN